MTSFTVSFGIVPVIIVMLTEGCTCAIPTNTVNEGANQVYLEPPLFAGSGDSKIYHGVVGEVFSAPVDAPGKCFSMVSIVTGQPEEMVYLTCPVETTDTTVSVGHLVASGNIEDTLHVSGIEVARQVRVARTEAAFSAEDARILRAVWLGLLGRARVKTGFPMLREVWRDYFFSVVRDGRFQGEYGAMTQNPTPGSTAAQLVELGHILAQIADEGDAASPKGVSLRSLVRSKAAALAKTLRAKPE